MTTTDRPAPRPRSRMYLPTEPMLLIRLDDATAEALITDTRGTWRVTWTDAAGWLCSCRARTASCGHVAAARTVIVTPAPHPPVASTLDESPPTSGRPAAVDGALVPPTA